MAQVAVRVLGPDDARVLARVAEGVFDGPVIAERARAVLADPAHLLIVALCDGEVVGAVLSVISRCVDKPDELWINEAGVADAWQRRGIGRALMRATLDAARARGCTGAWVASDMTDVALSFYRALGGEEEGGQTHFSWSLDRTR